MTNRDKVRIIVKGEDKTDSIRDWKEGNGTINITYNNGETYPYNKNNVLFNRSALSNDTVLKRFEYLKQIAQTVGMKDPDGGNILANHYEKIDFIDATSMISAFLTEKLPPSENTIAKKIIYPFGFNKSQKSAVYNAITNPFTIIEGPPGTGKTQTILNIIANAVMDGKSTAVVSNNNSATANVKEKLTKYQVDFIAAFLGNSENKSKFIESQKPLPDMTNWKLPADQKQSINESLGNLYSSLNFMLEKKNELSKIRQELDGINLEYLHFNKSCPYSDKDTFKFLKPFISSAAVLQLWLSCEKYVKRGKMPVLFERVLNHILFGAINKVFFLLRRAINKDFYYLDPDTAITICQKRWYMARTAELDALVLELQTELTQFNFDEKMSEYSSLSAQLFRDFLAEKYKNGKRRQFESKDLKTKSQEFIEEYPVILSTTYSLRSSLSNDILYDYVIIDEASQVDIATGALALSCAKKAVVVGDLKQLPNVVDNKTAAETDEVFTQFNLPEVYRFRNHSLLSAVTELFPNAPRTLLREHYRCHPKIIEFCNQKFYNNQLIILNEPKSNRPPLAVYKTVPGNHARDRVNQRQIDVIKDEVIPQQNLSRGNISIGIVTPYRNQTNALQEVFADTGIQADTVDKFQGRENDVIILSTVDNEISQFTDNANRLNVAVSRAIEQLVVVVNSSEMQDTNIGDLVRYVEYNNLEIVQSEIKSVFDYLYRNYNEKRKLILRAQGKISEYDSENLMYVLIRKVLNNNQFMRFDVSIHVPLKMILWDMNKLDINEKRYAQNYLTHVDFLIFDKIGKIPRLVIEVDGTAFHKKGTRQAARDKMKNIILEKYGLPYERFKTNESGEEERLIAALNRIMGL